MVEDAELLRRYARDHSEAAFTELVQRHLSFVYAAALRQLNGATHRAEDVTQSVFIDLARNARSLSQRTQLAGWLYTSTHFAAAKLKRTEQRREQREREASAMHDLTCDRHAAANWERLRPVLDDAMHELISEDREALLMRFFQGRRFAEVGQQLGLTEDAARMRVERSLDKLRLLLARRQITSTTSALGVILANQPAVAVPPTLAATVTGAALASGTGAVGGAAALVFMKTNATFATIVAVLTIGFVAYGIHEVRLARAEVAVIAKERDNVQARLGELQERLAATEKRRDALQQQVQAGRTMKDATAFAMPPATQPPQTASTAAGQWSFRAATPAEARARNGLNIDTTYAALYRQLDWTPAQREQFKNVMLDRQASGERLFKSAIAAARAQNPGIDRAGMFEVFEATNAQMHLEQQADIGRVFGEVAAQALKQYQGTLSVRSVANQLASALYNSESPLAPKQADQLVDILAQYARGPMGKVEVSALNTDAAVAQAQAESVLNAAQATELRRIAARAQEQSKADRERNTAPLAETRSAGK